MKILSSFDTDFEKKVIAEEVRKYGDKVFVIHKWKFFLWLHVVAPALFLILWFVLLAVGLALIDINDTLKVIVNVIIVIVMLTFVYYGYSILKQYIDYLMDFAVITPEQIINYNQTGLFSRQGRTLDVDKIKTITVGKEWILRSLFNFGNIIFLSEWDTSSRWDIELYFIDDPDSIKKKILRVIETTRVRHPDDVKKEENK